MKKVFFFLSVVSTFSAGAQVLKASLAPGSTDHRIKILVQSSAAVPETNISTLQFNVGILNTISPKPTATVIPNNTNFPTVTWQINEANEGGYNNFKFTTPNAAIKLTSLNTTASVEVMEVEFTGGPIDPQSVSLVSLPGGGSDQNFLFLCTGSPASDGTSLYYVAPGVTVVNGNTYEGSDVSTATITNIQLPVKFVSFYALKNAEGAKLNWTVENDFNNQYFEVQRSNDGRTYAAVGKVNAAANGQSVNSYELTDSKNANAATTYYRIKQVDKNGETTYSVIRSINVDKNAASISLYPNPARSNTKLVFDAPVAGKASISIRDAAGKQMQLQTMQIVKGLNQHTLNVQTLAAGEYTVTLIGTNLNQTVKLGKN